MLFTTISGRRLNLNALREEDIDLYDIAHSLSMICRYNGHVNRFYSVAEHSIHLALILPKALRGQALLHDASEAYLGDVSAPLKELFPDYIRIETQLQRLIFRRFDLPERLHPDIVKADIDIRKTEMAMLFKPKEHTPPEATHKDMKPMFLAIAQEVLNGVY